MAEGSEPENTSIAPQNNKADTRPAMPRRTILRKFAGLALAAGAGRSFHPPHTAEAQTVTNQNKERTEKPQTIFDWDNLYKQIDGLARLETDREAKGLLSEIKGQIGNLAESTEPRAKRLQEIAKLANEKKDVNGKTLMDYYHKLLGGREHVTVEDITPFLSQFRSMHQGYDYIDQMLQIWTKSKQEISNQNFTSEYLDLKNNLVNKQIGADQFVYEKAKANEQDASGVTILVDPNVRLTKEGNDLFVNQRRAIGRFLEKFPYFKKLYTKVLLFSSDYGELKDPSKNHGHTFQSRKQEGDKTQVGIVTINMGPTYKDTSATEPIWPELTFAHEAYGHGTDTSLNGSLEQRLSPEDYVDRRLFEEAILDNPDWGDHDQTIPQLFSNFNNTQSHYTLEALDRINREQYMKLITNYPRNVIYHNGSPVVGSGVTRPRTIFDEVTQDPIAGNALYDAPPELPASTRFENFDSFLQSYLPLLQKSTQEGNRRSQVILWGIKNFKKDFEKLDSLWNLRYGNQNTSPLYDKSGATWSNFCNVIVVNTTLYHVFNNPPDKSKPADQPPSDEIRALFTDEQRRTLEWHTMDLKRGYRYELWAEGNGYAHTLGDRLEESPPYRSGLNQLANLVSNLN